MQVFRVIKKSLTSLLVIGCLLLPVCAKSDCDGYLVGGLKLDEPFLMSETDLEYVALDIWKTQDPALARDLVEAGQAEYFEPNQIEIIPFSDPAESAWSDVQQNLAYTEALGLTGKNVRIAVIDSGLDCSNPNLAGADIDEGYDYCFDDKDPDDVFGHGTKVTQMIVGRGLNGCVKGTAPDATIVPLKIFYNQYQATTPEKLVKAIEDAVKIHHCQVLNLSWGFKPVPENTPLEYPSLHRAIQYAVGQGAIVVAASGNTNQAQKLENYIFPAAFEEVISVGAYDANEEIASFSIRNPMVTVSGPGAALRFCPIPGDQRTVDNGTSFSSPAVAGTVALMKQLWPEMNSRMAMEVLRTRARDLGPAGYDPAYGFGCLPMDALFRETYIQPSGGWVCNTQVVQMLHAYYRANGQMITCDVETLQPGIYGAGRQNVPNAVSHKLFLLGPSGFQTVLS